MADMILRRCNFSLFDCLDLLVYPVQFQSLPWIESAPKVGAFVLMLLAETLSQRKGGCKRRKEQTRELLWTIS